MFDSVLDISEYVKGPHIIKAKMHGRKTFLLDRLTDDK